jgi:hypothetical protein
MTAMDDDASVAAYNDSLANFGAAYAAMQETMKSQANSLVAMQNKLAKIQHFCMTIGQQPPSTATPPLSNNARSPITTNAMVTVRATAVVSHNIQP